MKPDKIFLYRGSLGTLHTSYNGDDVPNPEEYIRKDALMEWAEHMNGIYPAGAFQMMIDKLNSM